jgi:RNA polymerase sigma-70 factor (ECF subfamily)
MTYSEAQKFVGMVQENKGLIYKVTRIYCRNEQDRDDLFQEIVEQLWKSMDRYDSKYKLSTWMYRIALNVAISFYRKESVRRKARLHQEDHILIQEPEPTDNENLELLYQFIDELNSMDKALMLLYLEEKKAKEISDILGISASNVTTKVGRIKEHLRKRFETEKN